MKPQGALLLDKKTGCSVLKPAMHNSRRYIQIVVHSALIQSNTFISCEHTRMMKKKKKKVGRCTEKLTHQKKEILRCILECVERHKSMSSSVKEAEVWRLCVDD